MSATQSATLADFIQENVIRGECRCGKCADAGDPKDQPTGHTASVFFFDVALRRHDDEAKAEFRRLVELQKPCFGNPVNLFDGKEHSYIELGGWIGDQGMALMAMGAGAIFGLWKLLTPALLGLNHDNPLGQQLAGAGYVTVQAET